MGKVLSFPSGEILKDGSLSRSKHQESDPQQSAHISEEPASQIQQVGDDPTTWPIGKLCLWRGLLIRPQGGSRTSGP